MMKTIDTAAIESLRSFAIAHGEIQFAHLCTAALAALNGDKGEEWAVERVSDALKRIEWTAMSLREPDDVKLTVIRNTDTTRADGAIARTLTL